MTDPFCSKIISLVVLSWILTTIVDRLFPQFLNYSTVVVRTFILLEWIFVITNCQQI